MSTLILKLENKSHSYPDIIKCEIIITKSYEIHLKQNFMEIKVVSVSVYLWARFTEYLEY